MGRILAFMQTEDGAINRASLEALQGARQLAAAQGHAIGAVVFGTKTAPDQLTPLAIDEILLVPNAELADYSADYYVAAMAGLIAAENPALVIAGHTYQAREWLPQLAARLGKPLVSDCLGPADDTGHTWTRPVFQGKIIADVKTGDGLALISFQAGAYRGEDLGSGSPSVRTVEIDLSAIEARYERGEKFREAGRSIDLTRAERIVAVGRGIGEEEHLEKVRDLAQALNAELASSRPVVDYGWLAHDRQVGSSGQTVAPKLYLAVGISGAIQHQVGMKNAGCIVAINKDPHAPIFEIADYGLVADLQEIVPRLTKALNDGKPADHAP